MKLAHARNKRMASSRKTNPMLLVYDARPPAKPAPSVPLYLYLAPYAAVFSLTLRTSFSVIVFFETSDTPLPAAPCLPC